MPPASKTNPFRTLAFLVLLTISIQSSPGEDQTKRPNIVLITADDLNYDSLGAYGCQVPGITPRLDSLAANGLKFNHAHVNIAVCQPSRQSIMTGRYPHTNGAPGFDPIAENVPTLTEILRQAGYLNGILGKEKHLRPIPRFAWDFIASESDLADGAGIGRSPEKYRRHALLFIKKSLAAEKPFFLMANMHDPHRPFAGSDQEKKSWGHDLPEFTRKITTDEITVPDFLPDLPPVRMEIAEYYTSVHRCDQIVGVVLDALEETGQHRDTIVMFLSDNGISIPFAKSNCYLNSTKTPWIVRWPGTVEAGSIDSTHPVSGIDFMPTVLDILGLDSPAGTNGTSFLPLLQGREQPERRYVFTEYHRTFARRRYPMRAVLSSRYGYIFNFWANRTAPMRMESLSGRTFKAMRNAAARNPAIAARVEFFEHRVPEEFYDLENDPDALENLIDRPELRDEIEAMRSALAARMAATGDPALHAFRNRSDPAALDAFMEDPGQPGK